MATTANTKSSNQEKLAKLVGPTSASEDARARDNLIIARTALLLRHSFFGNLATRMKMVNADSWLPTAAVDGRNFYYNSRFVNMLQPGELEFLVGHEVLHLVYDHLGRRDIREPSIWNIANDYTVNADLKRHRVGQFITTVPCLYEPKYDGKSSEEIYDDLIKNVPQNLDELIDKILDDHLDGNGESESDGNGDKDGKSGRPKPLTDEEREQLRQDMKQNIINAARAAKDAGHGLPGGVERLIQNITQPKMPWRELIQANLISTIRTDYSFIRPSRRGWHVDAVLPGTSPGEEIDIIVALDTSGSIGNEEISVFLGEIKGIMDSFDGYRIKVFCFDTGVHAPADFTSENLEDICEYQPAGGGGTDFTCIFDYLKEEAIVPNRLIVFTDMMPYGSWGDENYCDTTWIGIGEYAKSVTPPFGTWAHYTE